MKKKKPPKHEKEVEWLKKHFTGLIKKYAGKSVALAGNHLAAVGKSEKEVGEMAKKKYPEIVPLVFTVPREEELSCVLLISPTKSINNG